MDAVNIRIGHLIFDHADYDAESDVLYLHIGEPQPAEGKETPEGHLLRFVPGTQQIVGLTIVGARERVERDGQLQVTAPEVVVASGDSLAGALQIA
ncbi:MAG TPA: DUF2283 domain-containing protein [Solirubrobacteraceae bacterium]|nr:DUF2283 domain-containing protein [Solirubrobacteraceae bacterium]